MFSLLSDTHPKIKEAAFSALEQIGATVENPEIAKNVDVLIKALSNPFYENQKGLEVLLKTDFAHSLDDSSLSIIMPIVNYGLIAQDAKSREYAGKIVAKMSSLIKYPKSLHPYSDSLLMALKSALADSREDVRNTVAKAFGSIAKYLDRKFAEKIIEMLTEILHNPEAKTLERAGASQSLSEVLCCFGIELVDKLLDSLLQDAKSPLSYLKEGYIGLFLFIPRILDEQFEPYLEKVLATILASVAEEEEKIRQMALRVLHIIISKYGLKKVSILLPAFQKGIMSESWLERSSSVILLGNMFDILKEKDKNSIFKIDNISEVLVCLLILKSDPKPKVRDEATNVLFSFFEAFTVFV